MACCISLNIPARESPSNPRLTMGPLQKEKERKELTRADAEEILTNLFASLEVLARIDEQQNSGKKTADSVE